MPRLRAPTLLGILSAPVGLISIVSALTPNLANRSDLVQGVLPPGVPSAARWIALAFGLALLWLAGSLARGKRRAWQLAVALVPGVAIAHLAKGLDAEEAGVSVLLLLALIRYRRHFHVPGDPDAKPLVLTMAALGSITAALVLYEFDESAALPEDLIDVATATAMLLAFRALYLWVRSWRRRDDPTAAERRLARELVARYGCDTLSYFALRRDKSYFFSPDRRSFVAYTVLGGAALVSGDPVGDAAEFGALLGGVQVGRRMDVVADRQRRLRSWRAVRVVPTERRGERVEGVHLQGAAPSNGLSFGGANTL